MAPALEAAFKAWRSRPLPVGAVLLLCVCLGTFGDVLLLPNSAVLSAFGNDVSLYFAYCREFGFDQLRQLHLALWNPYISCGNPFLGNFQSALLYPPNWSYLLLPVRVGINCEIGLSVFLASLWMYWWGLRRGLHPLAALLSGLLYAYSAPFFLKIDAGHLTALDAMSWTPLVLLSLDAWWADKETGWLLLGIFGAAMQLLAGHPQTVFNTVVAALIYFGLRSFNEKQRLRCLTGWCAVFVGGALLAAAQVVTGLEVSSEATRAHAVPYMFVTQFSLPPENLLTLLAPDFLGNLMHRAYWGRWYEFENSLFMGVSGLCLAGYGLYAGRDRDRKWIGLTVGLLLLLALGGYTPIFRLMFDYVPGFNKFRSLSKFTVEASLFLALLAGMGFDSLLKKTNDHQKLSKTCTICGALLALGALPIFLTASLGSAGWWGRFMLAVQQTGQTAHPPGDPMDPRVVAWSGLEAAVGLLIGGAVCFLMAGLLRRAHVSRHVVKFVGLLAACEVLAFARTNRPTFDWSTIAYPEVRSFLQQHPGDYRVLQTGFEDSAMSTGAHGIWGYDPVMLERTTDFIARSQNIPPLFTRAYFPVSHWNPILSVLRFRYRFEMGPHNVVRFAMVPGAPPPLARLLLMRHWVRETDRDKIYGLMSSAGFDATDRAILETEPEPLPDPSGGVGTVRLVGETTDSLTIEADVPAAQLLLVSDAYCAGWRAVPLEGSSQQRYQVLPADFMLRAIPLARGHHLLRLEYRPRAFVVGCWISIVALIAYCGLLCGYVVNRRRIPAAIT